MNVAAVAAPAPTPSVDAFAELQARVERLLRDDRIRPSTRRFWSDLYDALGDRTTYEDLQHINGALERARPGSPSAHQ